MVLQLILLCAGGWTGILSNLDYLLMLKPTLHL